MLIQTIAFYEQLHILISFIVVIHFQLSAMKNYMSQIMYILSKVLRKFKTLALMINEVTKSLK